MTMKIAACCFELGKAKTGRIQLLPYGEFRAVDGRPTDVPCWIIADSNGADLVELANNASNPLPIDYEHQILHSQTNGKEAPSAGWMEYLYLTPQGIFADVRWTDKAAQYIQNGEYRYISAVFAYDADGYVRKIFHAALVNAPALDGMEEVMVAASAQLLTDFSTTRGNKPMNEKILAALSALCAKQLRTEAEVEAELDAVLSARGESAVALSQVYAELNAKEQRIAALSADVGKVDPAQYVPVAQVAALQQEMNQLRQSMETNQKSALITAALSSGKLAPSLQDWAQSLSVEALSQYLDKVEPLAALGGQAQAKGAPVENVVALSQGEIAAARALGMSEAEYIRDNKTTTGAE